MKIWRIAWITGLSLFVLMNAWSEDGISLTVLTYNIHHGEGLDNKIDLPRIASIIRSVSPDLVALQEVDVKTSRSGGADQSAELSRLTGLSIQFTRAIDYGGGQYGIACMYNPTRIKMIKGSITLLPSTPDWEHRVLVDNDFQIFESNNARPDFRFFFTHYDYHQADTDRLPSAELFQEIFSKERSIDHNGKPIALAKDFPSLFAGDLNDTPDSRVLQVLKQWWFLTSGENPLPTIPSEKPDRKIDFILYRPQNRWKVIETKVLDEPLASDHRPYMAKLLLLPN